MKIDGSDRYWNPILETMPREQLRELQLRKFKRIVQWSYDHSGLYRSVYDEAGFKPGDLQHLRRHGQGAQGREVAACAASSARTPSPTATRSACRSSG